MSLAVCGLAPRVELLHLRAVGGQGATAIRRHAIDHALEGNIEPDDGAVGQHRGAILRVDACAAAGGHDDMTLRQQFLQDGAFDAAEVGLALACEDLGDALVFQRLDTMIDVLDTPPHPPAQCARHAGLARAHEAYQVQLVYFHARSDSSTVKNSGYDTPAAPAS